MTKSMSACYVGTFNILKYYKNRILGDRRLYIHIYIIADQAVCKINQNRPPPPQKETTIHTLKLSRGLTFSKGAFTAKTLTCWLYNQVAINPTTRQLIMTIFGRGTQYKSQRVASPGGGLPYGMDGDARRLA